MDALPLEVVQLDSCRKTMASGSRHVRARFRCLTVNPFEGVPLRNQCYHCSGSGCCCGTGSVPGPGTSTCHEHSQKYI